MPPHIGVRALSTIAPYCISIVLFYPQNSKNSYIRNNIRITDVITMLDVRINRVGNSHGIIIPSKILKLMDLEKGSRLKLETKKGYIKLTILEDPHD